MPSKRRQGRFTPLELRANYHATQAVNEAEGPASSGLTAVRLGPRDDPEVHQQDQERLDHPEKHNFEPEQKTERRDQPYKSQLKHNNDTC